jgi:hypothetical protein
MPHKIGRQLVGNQKTRVYIDDAGAGLLFPTSCCQSSFLDILF